MSCDIKNEACNFRCSGYDGSKVWDKLHKLPKEIDCEECASHADLLFKGIHDHVNIGLGKPPNNKENFRKFAKEIQCTYDRCVKEGRC